MRYLTFAPEGSTYPIILLSRHLRGSDLAAFVQGIEAETVAYSLLAKDKPNKADILDFFRHLLPMAAKMRTDYLLVTDGAYFKVLTGAQRVDRMLGYVLPCVIPDYEHLSVLYMPSPGLVMRDPSNKAKIQQALKALGDHRNGRYLPPGSTIIQYEAYPFTVAEIKEWLDKLIDVPLAIDIETKGLKHYSAGIGTMTLCWSQHEGIAFSVDKDRTPKEAKEVRRLLRAWYEARACKTLYHRAWFDVYVLTYQLFMKDVLDTEGLLEGLKHLLRKFEDTQLIRYLATNTCAGNKLSLKDAAQPFSGSYAVDVKDIDTVPLSNLLTYNLIDGLSTWYVYNTHYQKMVDDQQLDIYENLFKPMMWDIIQMQLTGLPLDMEEVKRGKAIMEADRKLALDAILTTPEVTQLNGIIAQEWAEKRNAELKKKRVTPADCKDTFNVNSNLQLQRLLHDVMGLPVIETTDSGQPATGMDNIEELMSHATQQNQKDLLVRIIKYKMVEKLLSSFIPAFEAAHLAPDGWYYLYGSFNPGGTLSGRLSCVAEWTRIQTQRGLVPIRDLVPGDRAWTHARRWRSITRLIKKPVEQMVDVRFSNGYVLTCTTAHKLRLPTGEWVSVQEIIDDRIQNVDAEPCQYQSDPDNCEDQSDTNLDCSSQTTGNQGIERKSGVADSHASCRVRSTEGTAVLHLQGGREEPHEGEVWNSTPSMARGSFGSQGVPDDSAQRRASVRTSSGYGTGAGLAEVARRNGCPSHRQQFSEQFTRQSGASNQNRAQDYPLVASDVCFGEIQAIHYRGPAQVWDISVEEDESYWAEGCFNHNSSDPNLQNLPANAVDPTTGQPSIYPKLIKKMFRAPPGKLFIGLDFNSLEDMISALTTKDPNKLKVYTDGFDGHCLRAAYYFQDQLQHIDLDDPKSVNSIKKTHGHLRQDSKAPTFALTYQGTWRTLVNNCGFSTENAQMIEKRYHEMYVVSDQWVQDRLKVAAQVGYVTVAFGLRLRTPMMKQTVMGLRNTPYEAVAEGRTAGNAMGQSYCLLNSRAGMEFMQRVRSHLFHRLRIRPCAQIHDAQYYLVDDDLSLVHWMNTHLVQCVQWQQLPEIQHPTVKLGGELSIFHPNWSVELTIPNGADIDTIKQRALEHIKQP